MNGGTCTAVDLLLEAGPEGLLRMASILAHQRAPVRSLSLEPHPDLPGMQVVSLCIEGSAAQAQQVVKRLRRAAPVHAAGASPIDP